MRRFDKLKNIQKVNMLLESRTYQNKNRIDEAISQEQLKPVIQQNLKNLDIISGGKNNSIRVTNVNMAGYDDRGRFLIELTLDNNAILPNQVIIVVGNDPNDIQILDTYNKVTAGELTSNQKTWLSALKNQVQA